MKAWANESAPVPFSLPRSKYAYVNDMVIVDDRVDRAVEIKQVIDFVRSEDPRTQVTLADGSKNDFIPSSRILIPVNKEAAVASGIVKAEDAHLMVDTIEFKLPGRNVSRSELMLLDLFANFNWERPLFFTQPYIMQNLGLIDYLQYDGYAYRFVPIYTKVTSAWDIGRIDPDYAAPLMLNTFRYGNLENPKVYADHTIQYNLNASKSREGFGRVAKEFAKRGELDKAVNMVDYALEKLPLSSIRYSSANTIPLIEAYYEANAFEKGDELAKMYASNVMEYIEYYLQFTGAQSEMISPLMTERLKELEHAYYVSTKYKRVELAKWFNEYYKTLGADL